MINNQQMQQSQNEPEILQEFRKALENIKDFESRKKRSKTLDEILKVKRDLEASFGEIKQMQQGKLKKVSLKEVLNVFS
jgi:hypothetical protein